jgi:hypothetical protein
MVASQKTKLAYGVFGITAIIVFGLFSYWLKSQMGISFSESTSLSKYFPFNYLAPRQVIINPAAGIFLFDSFDSFSLFGNWNSLWMREQGKVSKGYGANGIDNSRCLFIKSNSTKSWVCSYKKMIRVREGDVFNYKVFVKLKGDTHSAIASMATFDADKKIINWNDFRQQTDRTNEWMVLEKTFIIPDGIQYIQFRLSGIGTGEFRFDNVYLKLLKKSPA